MYSRIEYGQGASSSAPPGASSAVAEVLWAEAAAVGASAGKLVRMNSPQHMIYLADFMIRWVDRIFYKFSNSPNHDKLIFIWEIWRLW